MGLITFPYSTLQSAGDLFSGAVLKKLYYLWMLRHFVKSLLPPTAFASFTGLGEYLGISNEKMHLSLAENVDLPAIFRTIDQGVCPGLILTVPPGDVLICSGSSLKIEGDTIVIAFSPVTLLAISVVISLTKTNSSGTAVLIPGSEWYLEISFHG